MVTTKIIAKPTNITMVIPMDNGLLNVFGIMYVKRKMNKLIVPAMVISILKTEFFNSFFIEFPTFSRQGKNLDDEHSKLYLICKSKINKCMYRYIFTSLRHLNL